MILFILLIVAIACCSTKDYAWLNIPDLPILAHVRVVVIHISCLVSESSHTISIFIIIMNPIRVCSYRWRFRILIAKFEVLIVARWPFELVILPLFLFIKNVFSLSIGHFWMLRLVSNIIFALVLLSLYQCSFSLIVGPLFIDLWATTTTNRYALRWASWCRRWPRFITLILPTTSLTFFTLRIVTTTRRLFLHIALLIGVHDLLQITPHSHSS